MGLREIFKFGKWQPDKTRSPPGKKEWPDHIISLNKAKFDDFIDKYPLVIVDFWAPWCRPCGILAPRIRQLSKKYKGRVAFGKINIDKYTDFARRYHALKIPKLIFFSYGQKVTSITGVKPSTEIQKQIEEILVKFDIV